MPYRSLTGYEKTLYDLPVQDFKKEAIQQLDADPRDYVALKALLEVAWKRAANSRPTELSFSPGPQRSFQALFQLLDVELISDPNFEI